jgi:hypothetical protein
MCTRLLKNDTHTRTYAHTHTYSYKRAEEDDDQVLPIAQLLLEAKADPCRDEAVVFTVGMRMCVCV